MGSGQARKLRRELGLGPNSPMLKRPCPNKIFAAERFNEADDKAENAAQSPQRRQRILARTTINATRIVRRSQTISPETRARPCRAVVTMKGQPRSSSHRNFRTA